MDALAPSAPVLPTPVGMFYCVCIFSLSTLIMFSCGIAVLSCVCINQFVVVYVPVLKWIIVFRLQSDVDLSRSPSFPLHLVKTLVGHCPDPSKTDTLCFQ